jgi:predicted RNase H-like nuclease (RuvC/YqgF family)
MAQLEAENAALATENDELRQFSMDGFQIAKNVQSLSNEREKLSVDLADKTDIISQLLEENRRLNKELEAYGIVEVEAGGKKFTQFALV